MLKKFKSKKSIITLGLIGALALTNAIPAFAGTTREFYDMSIRAYRGTSELTKRTKETDNQYSWVQITDMSGASKVKTKFKINGTLDATSWCAIKDGETKWQKLNYSNCGKPGSGTSIYLSACNYDWSTGTGSISGAVDYE